MRGAGGRGSLAAMLLLLLGACAQQPLAPTPGDSGALPLLAPQSFGAEAQVQQQLHVAYGKDEAALQSVVRIDATKIALIGLTVTGQRLFTLDYDGESLQATRAAFAPEQIAPERILADLQFAHWPLAALQAAWAPFGYSVSEPRPGLRQLRRDGLLIAETHSTEPGPWPARLWLVNLRYGYTLDIETQMLAP